MREIKFRAWDKKMNEMDYNTASNPFFSPEAWWDVGIRNIMQYTGLKDKNGKEIYEGDIVLDYNNKVKAFVKFEIGTFILCCDDYADSYITFVETLYDENECEEIEVIGNIYEHPELLECEK